MLHAKLAGIEQLPHELMDDSMREVEQLSALIRQSELKVRVDHDNLETVYLEQTPDGKVLVHDGGHAHNYLSTAGDRTYRDWAELGVEHIRQHCDRLGLSLENPLGDDSDPGLCICGRADTDSQVAELVNRVAVCQDDIFQSAYRDPT